MTPQEKWERAKKKLSVMRAIKWRDHPLEHQWDKRLVEIWKKNNQRKRKVPDRSTLADQPEAVAERDQWQAKANAVHDRVMKARDRWEKELNEAAALIDLVPGTEFNLADSVSSLSYRSQGYGAETYAQNSAESSADNYRRLGLEVEVRSKYTKYEGAVAWPYGNTTYEVWVKADPEMILIADRKPSVSLREWVRMCWKRGVNPRVYNPFLPHGYEEQVGIDYFGNDLKKEKEMAS